MTPVAPGEPGSPTWRPFGSGCVVDSSLTLATIGTEIGWRSLPFASIQGRGSSDKSYLRTDEPHAYGRLRFAFIVS